MKAMKELKVMKAKAKGTAKAKGKGKAKAKGKVIKPMKQTKKRQRQTKRVESWVDQVVGGAPMPNWSDHCVSLLADGFFCFRKKTGDAREVMLSVWSDCGGMGTELTALTQLGESVMRLTQQKLSVNNFCFCDKKAKCLQFAAANHKPLHTSKHIFDRDFDAGTFHCTTCHADHPFPPKTDVYVCCFPCGPWSLKGTRLGFSDRDGEIVWQAAKTINKLMPGVWYMENVMGLSTSKTGVASESDLKAITDTLAVQMPSYTIMCLQQLDPKHMGFPIHRSRLVITGINKDFTTADAMVKCFQTLVMNPMPCCADWRAFLGRPTQPKCDLSSIGDPLGDAADDEGACSCSIDPYQQCPLHPCQCRMCSKEKQADHCEWRKTHTNYIQKHIGDNVAETWVANAIKVKSYLAHSFCLTHNNFARTLVRNQSLLVLRLRYPPKDSLQGSPVLW